jgi:RNA polymerase sigma factor (sigma-70 family)
LLFYNINPEYPTIPLYKASTPQEVESMEHMQQLIEGCVNGNRQSQNELYNLLAPKMFVVCLRYSKNHDEAEEILQEGFIKMFEFIHQYKFNGSFEGWVRKIMVNCALQRYRSKRQMHAVVNIDLTAVEQPGNDDIISQIGTKELLKMVQQLSPAYRTIFNLYVLEGMKHREIAEHLGISEGTSKSNLSDARALLQKAVNNSMQFAKQNLNQV